MRFLKKMLGIQFGAANRECVGRWTLCLTNYIAR
jgi:hypothetical protein